LIWVELAAGLIYLLMGGDLIVRGAVALARRTRISPMIVALTIVSFGTSLPELVVSIRAALANYPGIVLGNVVGSNIANIMLVGGAAAVIAPLPTGGSSARRDSAIMLAVSFLLLAVSAFGGVSRLEGALLLLGFAAVFAITVRDVARDHSRTDVTTPIEWVIGLPSRLGTIAIFLIAGSIGLPLGAKMVVESAVRIAAQWGMSDDAVGLTIVAVSTSLPELATTVVAAWQRRTDVAIGTIIGSNVINILGVMAAAALVSPKGIDVPHEFLVLDLPVMIGAALVLTAFVWLDRPVRRTAGILFVTGYAAYVVSIFLPK
jgi:cation:H+ antiporter